MSAARLVIERSRNELSEAIVSVLESWSESERLVFTRSHYRGESVESISASLGMSVPEVRSMLEQCGRRLRQSLAGYRQSTMEALRSARDCASGFANFDYLC